MFAVCYQSSEWALSREAGAGSTGVSGQKVAPAGTGISISLTMIDKAATDLTSGSVQSARSDLLNGQIKSFAHLLRFAGFHANSSGVLQ
jgi:hypothetical protein